MKYSKNKLSGLGAASAIALMAASGAIADIVHLDDVIIDGSLCVGFDCVNGESFGFDTLRLKENNLRIRFQDTSNSASFPTNDWIIEANSSSNGGGNHLAFVDVDGGRTPFLVEAGARSNALYVDDGGRIGLGTSTPVVNLHVVSGNTPTMRLEQNGSSGFTPQTWDVAGNEANFFIRDATNGSTLPFRIRPGAPSSAIDIAADGDVGFGTGSPAAKLHILDTDAAFAVNVILEKNGTPRMQFDDSSVANNIWNIGLAGNSNFIWTHFDNPGLQAQIEPDGDMIIGGTLTQNSNRHSKTAIVAVDPQAILAKIETLPISSWTYKTDVEKGIRHIGPMAQDFYALFETGASETGISTMDTSGVALAAIKALSERNAELEARLELLEAKLAE